MHPLSVRTNVKIRTRKIRQIGESSFDYDSSSQFVNPYNFSDVYDPALIDFGGEGDAPVTEMTDAELRKLGFPVPTQPPDTAMTQQTPYLGTGGSSDFLSAMDSPYFQFTSRKYEGCKSILGFPY